MATTERPTAGDSRQPELGVQLGPGLAVLAALFVFACSLAMFNDLAESQERSVDVAAKVAEDMAQQKSEGETSSGLDSPVPYSAPTLMSVFGSGFSLSFLLTAFFIFLYIQLFATSFLLEIAALVGTMICIPFLVAVFAFQYYRLGVCEPHLALDCAYFSAVTITTLGYGDMLPITQATRLVAAVQAFIGFVVVPVLVAQLLNLIRDYKELPKDRNTLSLSQELKRVWSQVTRRQPVKPSSK